MSSLGAYQFIYPQTMTDAACFPKASPINEWSNTGISTKIISRKWCLNVVSLIGTWDSRYMFIYHLFCLLCELSIPIPCPFFFTIVGLFLFSFKSFLIYRRDEYFSVWIAISRCVLWIYSPLLWFRMLGQVVLIFTYFNLFFYFMASRFWVIVIKAFIYFFLIWLFHCTTDNHPKRWKISL